jgi:hypothetical protein
MKPFNFPRQFAIEPTASNSTREQSDRNKKMYSTDKMWSAEEAISHLHRLNTPSKEIVYSDEDYNSNDGMQTAIFGPVFWSSIHMVSFNYPVCPTQQQKQDYKHWIEATGKVLPCLYCRQNFDKNILAASHGDDYDSRDKFSRFCYRLHCEVNKMLKKNTNLSYESVRDIYEGFRSRCLTEKQKERILGKNKELGCVMPMHNGTKGKLCISVVPRDSPLQTFTVADTCRRKSVNEESK